MLINRLQLIKKIKMAPGDGFEPPAGFLLRINSASSATTRLPWN